MKTFESEIPVRENRSAYEAKILVVDDREDNLLSIESILEKEGYHIVQSQFRKGSIKNAIKRA